MQAAAGSPVNNAMVGIRSLLVSKLRAMMSVPPPAPAPTMICTGLEGQVSA